MALNIFGPTYALLEKVLDLRSDRHTLVSSNIANAETPGYRSVHLDFEDELKKALPRGDALPLARTDARHMPLQVRMDAIQPEVVYDDARTARPDGNTVDLDREVVRMSKNQLMYSTVTQCLGRKFKGLLSAIKETR